MIHFVKRGEFMFVQFNSPCSESVPTCQAMCCRMRRYYSVPLTEEEVAIYPHTKNSEGVMVLKGKQNGDCVYLDGTRCSIYDTRPKGCREWHCSPEGGLGDPEIRKRGDGWVMFPAMEAKQ